MVRDDASAQVLTSWQAGETEASACTCCAIGKIARYDEVSVRTWVTVSNGQG